MDLLKEGKERLWKNFFHFRRICPLLYMKKTFSKFARCTSSDWLPGLTGTGPRWQTRSRRRQTRLRATKWPVRQPARFRAQCDVSEPAGTPHHNVRPCLSPLIQLQAHTRGAKTTVRLRLCRKREKPKLPKQEKPPFVPGNREQKQGSRAGGGKEVQREMEVGVKIRYSQAESLG